jgi:hypothetical protein
MNQVYIRMIQREAVTHSRAPTSWAPLSRISSPLRGLHPKRARTPAQERTAAAPPHPKAGKQEGEKRLGEVR